jgi:hypothetical protein
VWLYLWGIVALFAWIAIWFATLFAGRSPDALHRFLAAYMRYQTHVGAYLLLVANPFPGFLGRPGPIRSSYRSRHASSRAAGRSSSGCCWRCRPRSCRPPTVG